MAVSKRGGSPARMLALLVALVMVLAACNGSSDETSTTAGEGDDDVTTTAADDGGTDTTAGDDGGTDTTSGEDDGEGGEGGTLEVALLDDIDEFDPQAFSAVNFPVIKNLYDSLIEYTAEGEAIPNLATEWTVADDNTSVTLTLRDDVVFQSGATMTSADVAATLEKASDPELGKNLFSTMSIVADWETPDDTTVTINFTGPTAEKQITDLLQFLSVIDSTGLDDVVTTPAGSGPFHFDSRSLGSELTLIANPDYWGEGPFLDGIHFTIFSDSDSASAALESGQVDLIYNVSGREGLRLQEAGFELVEGPGPLVQVLRINPNNGPLQNQTFRQGLAYLLNREAILEVGYGGIGEVTALPWAPNNPAADPSYNETYAYDPATAQQFFADSGLSDAEMADFSMLVNSGNESSVAISQVFQADLATVGIDIELELLAGAEYTDAVLGGGYDVLFGGVGNVQKFPTRVATNSIFRTADNPVVGEPMFPEYVEAIEQVDTTLGPEDAIQEGYDNLNEVIMDLAFGLATNTYQFGLIVADPELEGVQLDIDNIFIGRTIRK